MEEWEKLHRNGNDRKSKANVLFDAHKPLICCSAKDDFFNCTKSGNLKVSTAPLQNMVLCGNRNNIKYLESASFICTIFKPLKILKCFLPLEAI